jgi:uncharacterized membrane protein YsdA (DUF1294 family)
MSVYVAVAVAIICFILYALDRRFKGEPIDWFSASKLTVLGGLLSGGIGYTISSPEVIAEVVKTEVPAPAQEMFVGVPTF